jgi:mono/diheme cytochrome c family protein
MDSPEKTPLIRNALLSTAAAFALAAAAAFLTYLAFHHFRPHAETPAASADVSHGALVYLDNCASCHGAKLEGQPDWQHVNVNGRLPAPPLNGTGHGWRHSDAELFHMIKFSVLAEAGPGYQTDMPAFEKTLSDADIQAVVAFIRSRWPAGIQAAQAFLNPDRAGMPLHVDSDWRLPPDCEEPVRTAPASAKP